ncbi:ribosome recycling factor [Peptoniphilus koenoeneniae]|uniref:Ribosome-recycling factor n=1 Tax=Peptoniphilus koenoeneniae TaxID=507751 RepID=A0ABU0AS85_9FIRM|nr:MULTISPECIES: ribosome recycling factor [Peptoniphilus]ERT62222.1 ribosome recycling factor [Peptoniphilus sp. BV3C26]MDQ0274058.1 ribosome recycling factor [Peptoniphilus koenoeneniae]
MFSDIKRDTENKMKRTIEVFREDLKNIRAGRANPSILDKITVDYYGQQTPLNQVAGISAPEARLLAIQPWEAKMIPLIEKEILKSDLGLNPSNDGKIIRLVIPQLTEERRKDLVRVVKKNGEDSKIAVRNIRRLAVDEVKKLEKNKEISEDDLRDYEKQIQDLTDKYIEEIDEIAKLKENELMEI